MAASLEGETQQPSFRLDSLSVPRLPTIAQSSQDSVADYSDLDKHLSHRPFIPPTSSPAPESADPGHNFIPAQVRHAESAQTSDAGASSIGRSTFQEGEEAVAGGNLLRVAGRGPPVRKTNSGSEYPTWATQRAGSSRGASPARSGPSRPTSRAMNRVVEQEVDELDSSSPAPPPDEGEEEDSPPDVPTPASPPGTRRQSSRPTTPAKQNGNGNCKPVSAHKSPHLSIATAGPSVPSSRLSKSPSRPPPSTPNARRKPAPLQQEEETQESLFGQEPVKGRAALEQMTRTAQLLSNRTVSLRRRPGLTPKSTQKPLDEEEEEVNGQAEGEGAAADGIAAPGLTMEEGAMDELDVDSIIPDDETPAEQSIFEPTYTSVGPQSIRRSASRKIIPPSSDDEAEGEHDQSVLFTQTNSSGLDLKTPSQKAALHGSNPLDDISLGEIPREMQLASDTYVNSQSSATGQPSAPHIHPPSSPPARPSSPDLLPSKSRRRFNQEEETMAAVPPVVRRRRVGLHHQELETPPPSFDAEPSRKELFSSQSGMEYTQQSEHSMDHSFQATQYVATDNSRMDVKARNTPATMAEEEVKITENDLAQAGPSGDTAVVAGRAGETTNTQDVGMADQHSGQGGKDHSQSQSQSQTHSHSLQSNGSARTSGVHSSLEQTQTQIVTEDSQRRAQEAAAARQKEREASLERLKGQEPGEGTAHFSTGITSASNSPRKRQISRPPASPTKAGPASPAEDGPRIKPHRMLRRTGSKAMNSAPFLVANIDPVKPVRHTGLVESFSETNVGQVERSSISPTRLLVQSRDKENLEEATESGSTGKGEGSTLFSLEAEKVGGGIQVTVERHRRQRSTSTNVPEPTSSMQAEELIPLGIPTQCTASVSPDSQEASQPSQPVKRAGARRRGKMPQIDEVPSSPPAATRQVRTRDASSPPRSEPPTPPPIGDTDDVNMDSGGGEENNDEPEETLASAPKDNSDRSSRSRGPEIPQTLEATLIDGQGGTVPTLVIPPKMPSPARRYGANKVSDGPVGAPVHIKPSRQLTRRKHGSPDPIAGPSESLARLDRMSKRVVRKASNEDDASDDEEMDRGGPGPSSRKHARGGAGRSKRVVTPPDDVEMDADDDTDGDQRDAANQVDADGEGDEDEMDVDEAAVDEDETPESPPTPEDTTDYSFRPEPKSVKGKGKAPVATAPAAKKRKRIASPTPSPSPEPVTSKRARTKPRKYTPNGDSPAKSTRRSTASRAQSEVPGEPEQSDPESPPTPVDTTDYSFRPALPKKALLTKRSSDVTSVASSSTKRAKTSGKAAAVPVGKKGKAKAKAVPASPVQLPTRSQSVSASRATAEPTPSASVLTGMDDSEDEIDENNIDVDGPGVFAKFSQHWYAGRAIQRKRDGTYVVEFADADHSYLRIDQLRRGELRVGDKVRSNLRSDGLKAMYVVQEDWTYPDEFSDAERNTAIKVMHEKTGKPHVIALRYLNIYTANITASWKDRTLEEDELAHLPLSTLPDPAENASRSKPLAKSASKVVSGTDTFDGQVFLITPTGPETKPYVDLITRNGGTTCEWEDLFADPASPRGNAGAASKVTFGDGLKSSKVPYLITTASIGGEFDKAERSRSSMKAKVMCALAFGIPCLAPAYIEEALRDPGHDIRGFLLVPGLSIKHNNPTSQVVDPAWGKEGWEVTGARHELRPLKDKKVLFAGPKSKELLAIVTACLTGLGADSLKVVDSYTGEAFKDYDVVLVANKDKKNSTLPKEVRGAAGGCDVQWLKQICISGEWLAPTLYSWA